MERVFTFGFNTMVSEAKYFFLDHGLNFDFFDSSKLKDKIGPRTSREVADHT